MSAISDEGIYYQSLEVNIEVTKEESGLTEYWIAKDLTVRRKRFQEADGLEMTAIPDPDENPGAILEPGDEITVDVGPKTSVAGDGDRNMSNEDNTLAKIFTGIISSARNSGDLTWKAFAFTYQLDIVRTAIDYSADEETDVGTIVEEVFEEVKSVNETDMEYNVDVSENATVDYGDTRFISTGPVSNRGSNLVRRLKPYTDTLAIEIIKDLEKTNNAVFWVDSNNVLQFGPTKTANHKLSWILETDAGLKTPPYKSVRVIGDDIGTESAAGGWKSAKLMPDPTSMTSTAASVVNVEGKSVAKFGELREPTFTYEDASIRTKAEAENLAQSILADLQNQSGEGTIVIPGRPMIDLFDVVEMPDSFGVTSSGEQVEPAQYLVETVTHRINPSDGFITEITVDGLMNRYNGDKYYKYVGSGPRGLPQVELVQREDSLEEGAELGESVVTRTTSTGIR